MFSGSVGPAAMGAGEYNWRDFIFADADDLEEDRQWALGRKKQCLTDYQPTDDDSQPIEDDVPPSSHFAALSGSERTRLGNYQRMFPGEVCDVGQNPLKFPHTSQHGILNTLTSGMGLMWAPIHNCDHLDRWLLTKKHTQL